MGEVIEWANGKIEVHNPHRLASEVLQKYFRHSKFASFQRQLNYFGFRKLAGKGKMAPCSYVNDAATSDLRSLLLIKRKTTPSTSKEKGSRKREHPCSKSDSEGTFPKVNPVLAGILHRSSKNKYDIKKSKAVAKLATGKGIKHQLNGYLKDQQQMPAAVDVVWLFTNCFGENCRREGDKTWIHERTANTFTTSRSLIIRAKEGGKSSFHFSRSSSARDGRAIELV